MDFIKKYIKRILYTFLFIILSLLIFTTFYYFDIINNFLYEIFIIISLLLNIFIQTFILGKTCIKKGFLEGIKFNTILIILFTIINLLLKGEFGIRMLLYYLIMYLTSILGGCIGISKQTKKKTI